MRFPLVCTLFLPLVLTGCGVSDIAAPNPVPGTTLTGTVHGGQQPLKGASVYLYQAAIGGYGNASKSILSKGSGPDSNGNYYVTTTANGDFTITGDYSCTAGKQVYLYVAGGDPGTGSSNPAIGLMAVLGNCPGGNFLQEYPFVEINEITTVAAAYSLAGFATDGLHVADNESNLNNTTAPQAHAGLANAFANAANLVNVATGTPYTVTPPVNNKSTGTVPASEIITLADILAACVNTNGALTSGNTTEPCGTLFAAATTTGGVGNGTAPTNTATAAINIAHNPGTPPVVALYNLPVANSPFEPGLTTQPNDFTLAINYTQSLGLQLPVALAVDASGNAWVADVNSGVIQVSPTGNAVGTYDANGLDGATGIAIDPTGDVWAGASGGPAIVEISSTGNYLSGAGGYTGGGLVQADGIAIDATGNAWIANQALTGDGSLIEISGAPSAPVYTAYTTGGIDAPIGVAFDDSGNVWVTSSGNKTGTVNNVSVFDHSGATYTPYTGSPYTGGSLAIPYGIALNHAGKAWVGNAGNSSVTELINPGSGLSYANFDGGGLENGGAAYGVAVAGQNEVFITNGNGTLSELSSSGAAVSPSTGYGSSNTSLPQGVAVDGSGDVWVANSGSASLTEYIGLSSPVVTPIAAAVAQGKLGQRP
jgi:streptogramin lyase